MKDKWYDNISYDQILEVLGHAKATTENLGFLRDNLWRILAPLSTSWYPLSLGTFSAFTASQDQNIPFPFEIHHIEIVNTTGQDLFINFDNTAGPGRGVRIPNNQYYNQEVCCKELHVYSAVSGYTCNAATLTNNFSLVVGRRLGYK